MHKNRPQRYHAMICGLVHYIQVGGDVYILKMIYGF